MGDKVIFLYSPLMAVQLIVHVTRVSSLDRLIVYTPFYRMAQRASSPRMPSCSAFYFSPSNAMKCISLTLSTSHIRIDNPPRYA
jgi:hypothetical protein